MYIYIYKCSLWCCDCQAYFPTMFSLFLVCKQTAIIVPWHLVLIFWQPPVEITSSFKSCLFSGSCIWWNWRSQCDYPRTFLTLHQTFHQTFILPSGFAWSFGWSFLTWMVYVFPWLYCKCLSELDRKNLFCCSVLRYYWRLIKVTEKIFWGWGRNVSFCASAHLPGSAVAKCCPFIREILPWMSGVRTGNQSEMSNCPMTFPTRKR